MLSSMKAMVLLRGDLHLGNVPEYRGRDLSNHADYGNPISDEKESFDVDSSQPAVAVVVKENPHSILLI